MNRIAHQAYRLASSDPTFARLLRQELKVAADLADARFWKLVDIVGPYFTNLEYLFQEVEDEEELADFLDTIQSKKEELIAAAEAMRDELTFGEAQLYSDLISAAYPYQNIVLTGKEDFQKASSDLEVLWGLLQTNPVFLPDLQRITQQYMSFRAAQAGAAARAKTLRKPLREAWKNLTSRISDITSEVQGAGKAMETFLRAVEAQSFERASEAYEDDALMTLLSGTLSDQLKEATDQLQTIVSRMGPVLNKLKDQAPIE